jgi:hypothetical protein
LPSLQKEVRIERRGSTGDQKIEDWALGLLAHGDTNENDG